MIVSNCPRCNETLRIPDREFPEDAYGRCPWCGESFPLSGVLNELPPVLEIFSNDGHPIVAEQHAGIGDGSAPGMSDFDAMTGNETIKEEMTAGGTWDTDRSADTDEDFPQLQEPLETRDDPRRASPVASMKVAPRRTKQNKGSGIKSAIGIVLGGLLSLPIAGGILLAFGRAPDLGFWPFDGQSGSSPKSVAAAPVDLSDRATEKPSVPAGRSLTSGLTDTDESSAGDPADLAMERIMNPAPDEVPLAETNVADAGTLRTGDSQQSVDAEVSTDASIAMPTDETITAPPNEIVTNDPVESPPPAADAMAEAPAAAQADPIAVADQAVDALLGFQGTEQQRRVQLARAYGKIAEACQTATGPDESLRMLAIKIGSSSVLEDVAYAGTQWLEYKGRSSNGIVLIGQPGVNASGPILTLDSGKVVSITGNPLPSSSRVMAMGRIIEEESSVELVLAEPLP